MIYLDYAANCPVDEEVLNCFYNTTKKYYANPNSIHYLGQEVKRIIDDATKNIANSLNILPEEVIYTSGATEANNLAIKGIAKRYKSIGKHIIVSTLEHTSVIASCSSLQEEGFDIDVLPVDQNGYIDIDALKKMLRNDTILVSICSVDSELGVRQPIEQIAKLLKTYPNVHFHSDATHAIGKVNIDYTNVDLITISPHKFYGLTGIGLLIKKKNTDVRPIINGGRSTTVYRSGTPEVGNICAASFALEKAIKEQETHFQYVKRIYTTVVEKLQEYPNIHINNVDASIPFTLNISINGIKSNDFVKLLEENDIIVSAKTSCCPIDSPSKLVYALTKDKKLAATAIRISFSHLTTDDEIEKFLDLFDKCIKEVEHDEKNIRTTSRN